MIAEVTNTPWGERHSYVLGAEPGAGLDGTFAKRLHVSPFMPMEQTYRWRLSEPGEELRVSISSEQGGGLVFEAEPGAAPPGAEPPGDVARARRPIRRPPYHPHADLLERAQAEAQGRALPPAPGDDGLMKVRGARGSRGRPGLRARSARATGRPPPAAGRTSSSVPRGRPCSASSRGLRTGRIELRGIVVGSALSSRIGSRARPSRGSFAAVLRGHRPAAVDRPWRELCGRPVGDRRPGRACFASRLARSAEPTGFAAAWRRCAHPSTACSRSRCSTPGAGRGATSRPTTTSATSSSSCSSTARR